MFVQLCLDNRTYPVSHTPSWYQGYRSTFIRRFWRNDPPRNTVEVFYSSKSRAHPHPPICKVDHTSEVDGWFWFSARLLKHITQLCIWGDGGALWTWKSKSLLLLKPYASDQKLRVHISTDIGVIGLAQLVCTHCANAGTRKHERKFYHFALATSSHMPFTFELHRRC